jgi:large subunit ribosomal protein L35
MGKQKTIKAVAKRFKLTKKNKLMKKTCGQDHFNSRESGKVTRNKRRLQGISKANVKNIKRCLPYSN